jgi:hypothetical protein
VSILDRINKAAASGGEQRVADVPSLVGTWQDKHPMMYTSQGILPDTSTLAQWMQAQMDSGGGLKITRQ